MALPALWAGLLYDRAALDGAASLVDGWTEEERQTLRDEVPRLGLATPFRGRTLLDVAREVVELAEGGLKRRAQLDENGEDETKALKPLIETVGEGRTEADRLLAAYEGPWAGNIDRLFETEAL